MKEASSTEKHSSLITDQLTKRVFYADLRPFSKTKSDKYSDGDWKVLFLILLSFIELKAP